MKTLSLAVVMLSILGPSVARAQGGKVTVKGYVIDSACAFVKNLRRPVSRACAIACAKAGSPLVILSNTGEIYWPISGAVPAAGQNQRLLPFAGRRVVVTGTVYDKGGSKAIVIAKLKAASKSR